MVAPAKPDYSISEVQRATSQRVPIPELTEHGLLPLGVHPATLEEVVARFGTDNPRRVRLGEALTRFVDLLRAFGLFTNVFVDGSFTTDRELPGDVDVIAHLPVSKIKTELHRHARWAELERDLVKQTFEVDLLIEPSEAGHAMMVAFFQTLKAKDLISRKVPASHRRGILKVRV